MARIGKLNIELGANIKPLKRDLGGAGRQIDKFTKDLDRRKDFRPFKVMEDSLGRLKSAGSILGGMARTVTGLGAAAGVAAAGLGAAAKAGIDMVGDQADAAKKLGLTRNELVTLQRAGKAVGIENDKLTASFEKMSSVLGSAFRGDAGAVKAIEGIGLKVKDLERMNPAQRFMAIGAAIDKIEDPAKKLAASRGIFGKTGGDMTNLFEGGAAAIREAAAELGIFGVLLNNLQTSAIERAGDTFDKMGTVVDGVKTQLAAEFAPVVEKIGKDLEGWLKSIGGVPGAMDLAIAKMGEGATIASGLGGSGVAAVKTAGSIKDGIVGAGAATADYAAKELAHDAKLLGLNLDGDQIKGGLKSVLTWNPVRDTVGAIYGKHKSDQDLAAMEDRAALRMKTNAKPKTAMGAVDKYLNDARVESEAAYTGVPVPEAKTTGAPSYADWRSGRKRDPDLPKYDEKRPTGEPSYAGKRGQSMLTAAEQDPYWKPGYADKKGPSMAQALDSDPVGRSKGRDSNTAELQAQTQELRAIRQALRGGVPARYS